MVGGGTGGFAQYNDFRMGGGIAIAEGAIISARQNVAIFDEDGADGDFVRGKGGAGLGKSKLHEFEIAHEPPLIERLWDNRVSMHSRVQYGVRTRRITRI